jgi:hypothetical protein
MNFDLYKIVASVSITTSVGLGQLSICKTGWTSHPLIRVPVVCFILIPPCHPLSHLVPTVVTISTGPNTVSIDALIGLVAIMGHPILQVDVGLSAFGSLAI